MIAGDEGHGTFKGNDLVQGFKYPQIPWPCLDSDFEAANRVARELRIMSAPSAPAHMRWSPPTPGKKRGLSPYLYDCSRNR